MRPILDFVLGRSLSDHEETQQKIGASAAIPVLGLDALTSAAYGPEAAATILIPLGMAGAHFVLPIVAAICILLSIVYFSYRQTIETYPSGGGSYIVARENLGVFWGLLAAASLLLDYVLVVAVGISAGIGALISAVPFLQPYTLLLCMLTLAVLTIVNLRGIKESGAIFMIPTYLFVGTILGVIFWGLISTWLAGGHPIPLAQHPVNRLATLEMFSWWLILRAFSSGCTAMAGVEAVSNGMTIFKVPVTVNAKRTLGFIIGALLVMLLGSAYLANIYGLVATTPGSEGYETLLSELVAAIVGRSWIYSVTMGSVVLALMLSANTGFADFPRLCQILARDHFLPHLFAERGRRLVFTYGILFIAFLAGLILYVFDGITDNLIPLYAIGAFLAFTLSQSGMVGHWLRNKDAPHRNHSLWINATGAFATGLTLIVILISKFSAGGWFTVILIPFLMWFFYSVRKHYAHVLRRITTREVLNFDEIYKPIVILPMRGWNRMTLKAMRFALKISDEIYGVYVDGLGESESVKKEWQKYVLDPSQKAGHRSPTLVILPSPYRRLFSPLLSFIDELEKEHPSRQVAVLIPGLVEGRWYHYFLHNQRALLLQGMLRLRSDHRIIVITVPWYL